MNSWSAKDKTKVLILATILIWIGYDFWAYFQYGSNIATESWTVWKWSYRIPGIAFICGVLCGHFFFQMSPPEDLSRPIAPKNE